MASSIKKLMKMAMKKFLPQYINPYNLARKTIEKAADGRILSGPFAGMKYATQDPVNIHHTYLLGTHELELRPIIEKLCHGQSDNIVNVGAALGYYAVGLALRNPKADVTAFEANSSDRNFIKKMAEINGVQTRLDIKGLCDISLLSESVRGGNGCLVIMDIEGGESILLDPVIIPRLKECHILVELHDFIFREIGDIISRRFKDSHDIIEVWSRPRTFADFPVKVPPISYFILKNYFVECMYECRSERMRWFYLTPKI